MATARRKQNVNRADCRLRKTSKKHKLRALRVDKMFPRGILIGKTIGHLLLVVSRRIL